MGDLVALPWVEAPSRLLSDDQEEAIGALLRALAAGDRVLVLTGPAGTGKTTILAALEKRLRALPHPRRAVFAAPTGKAAVRLLQSVPQARATTIHRALYGRAEEAIDPVTKQPTGKLVFGEPHAPCGPTDALVIDEASMVGRALHDDLVNWLPPEAALVYVGDREQLAPVQDTWGPNFAHPTAVLTAVHRQAMDSPILRLATEIRLTGLGGVSAPVDGRVQLHGFGGCRAAAMDPVAWLAAKRAEGVDATLLTWTNRVRQWLNVAVRSARGLEGPTPFVAGDIVVCRTNNHGRGVMNGETFLVTDACVDYVDGLGPVLQVFLEGHKAPFKVHSAFIGASGMEWRKWVGDWRREAGVAIRRSKDLRRAREAAGVADLDPALDWLHVDHGECLTIHLSQGSQWEHVGIVVDNGMRALGRRDPGEAKRLFYTAVTRASHRLTLWSI